MNKIKPLYRNIIFCIVILLAIFISVSKNFVIVNSIEMQGSYGIIDGYVSSKPDNVIFNESAKTVNIDKSKTHGDKMIEFAHEYTSNINLYYFDASDDEGKIKTDKIIEGLEWMSSNSVQKVNLSLSSKSFSIELSEWIRSHNNIKVYASYNNVINTNDYPAKYDFVYAFGYDNRINYKNIDIQYNSSKIILLSKRIKLYEGTSYLSIISMLKN